MIASSCRSLFTDRLFTDRPPIAVPSKYDARGDGCRAPLMRLRLVRLVSSVQRFAFWNRSRPWHWCDTADGRRAWRERRSRYEGLITLGRCRTDSRFQEGC